MARGTIIITKASVSSLIPKIAPKQLNRSMTMVIMMLLTPNLRITPICSSFWVERKKEKIPTLMALLLFMIQKAPPMIRIKAIIPACFSNPLKRAENTCHVCGLLATSWNESFTITVRSTPLTSTVSRAYSPPGIIQVRMAQMIMIENTMVYVCGTFFSITGCVFRLRVQIYKYL